MFTNREVVAQVELATLQFITATGDMTRARIRATARPRDEQAQTDSRFFEAARERALKNLVEWCGKMIGPDSTEVALHMLSNAISHAEFEAALITRNVLQDTLREAA